MSEPKLPTEPAAPDWWPADLDWPSRFYNLADGRVRLSINLRTHRLRYEHIDEESITLSIEPRVK